MIPKFRAWDKKDKAIRDVTHIIYMYESVVLNVERTFYERTFCEIELMQLTGLKDKNGTEIYEGDIVKYNSVPNPFLSDNYFKIIQARSGEWRIDNYIEGRVLIFNDHQVEVVGNIFENKELLEDKVNGH